MRTLGRLRGARLLVRKEDHGRPMWPAERELRSGSVHLANWDVTDAALSLCGGAATWLGYDNMQDAYNKNAWPDVLTEAICAAATWGL